MKKKLLIIAIICLTMFLVSCSSDPVQVNVTNADQLASNQLGVFIDIGNNLSYDSATRVVYIENYTYNGSNVYTTYYSSNGLLYRYNPETNTLEEINK